jgi:predicted enzyme related to lactoylglutathione lyase
MFNEDRSLKQDALPMANKLDHIAIFVEDLDAAIGFYGETIGLGVPIIKAAMSSSR